MARVRISCYRAEQMACAPEQLAGGPVLMTESVTAVCGPRDRHNPDRVGYRYGTEAGSVTLGGRRVPVQRPRVRAVGSGGR